MKALITTSIFALTLFAASANAAPPYFEDMNDTAPLSPVFEDISVTAPHAAGVEDASARHPECAFEARKQCTP
jgi:hypothetical protein